MRTLECLDTVEIVLENVDYIEYSETLEPCDLEVKHNVTYYVAENGEIAECTDDVRYYSRMSEALIDPDEMIEIQGDVLTKEMLDLYETYEDCDSDLLQRVYNRYAN